MSELCPRCSEPIAIRNPSGKCDHLYYPEYLPPEAKAKVVKLARKPVERRHRVLAGRCDYCDEERKAGNNFHPAHDPAPDCSRQGNNHCTCERCFK